jgi:CHAT domain-containing protein
MNKMILLLVLSTMICAALARKRNLHFLASNSLIKISLIAYLSLIFFSAAYSQESQANKEIDDAIMNALNGNCEAAIPVLEKYASNKRLDDLKILSINANLNLCYLLTQNKSFKIDYINTLLDSYIKKYGVTRRYQLKSADEIDLIYSVGLMNMETKNFKKSITYLTILRDIYEENNFHNQTYLNVLQLLLRLFNDTNNYIFAIDVGQKAQTTSTSLYGNYNETHLNILTGLYTAYVNSFSHERALQCLMKMLEISEKIYGEKSDYFLTILNNLYTYYSDIGSFQKSLEINKKVIGLRREISGTRDLNYLNDMANMAATYIELGEFALALEINQEISVIQKDVLGVNDKAYLSTMCNLAMNYSYFGNHERALELFNKIIEAIKETYGVKNREYLRCLGGLSNVYNETGKYQKALGILLELVELQKELFGIKDPDYLTSLNNLAICYSRLNNFQKSLEINQIIVDIRKITFGEKHPDYLISLGNMAMDYSSLGNYSKALEINEKVVKSAREVFGEKHPNYFIAQGNLAGAELDFSDFNSAFNHFQIMLKGLQDYVVSNFAIMTEQQRGQLWNSWSFSFAEFPLFLENITINQHQNAEYPYDVSLFTKELLLNISLDFIEIITKNGTPEAIAKYEELKLLRLQIQRLQEKPVAERYLNTDSLKNIAQQKETELVKLSKEYGDYTRNLKITWKDVQENLNDNDVAIEFVEYPTLSDTIKYAALVLRKGWQYPKMISLFRKDQIDEYLSQDENEIYSNGFVGKQVKKFIWEPLEEYISARERVYFSPAGIIHQLAIENLPASDSTTLGDQYQMYRLSSTKELTVDDPVSPIRSSVLFGGLEYAMEDVDMKKESKKYEFEKSRSYLAFRGYNNDTTKRSGWEYLKGTKPEVEQISQVMREKQYQVKELTGISGNEESFKSLSGEPHGIIHIATHGFFLPIEESLENPFIMQRAGDQQQDKPFIDPMLRSGLIMSGGNRAWLGEKIPENVEDGVLTAKEISHLDLRGTDLVVLSACETGLGEVSSEGVFGLQRSFKQAGVNTLVMSLWEVNDDATKFMMTEFYSNLAAGDDKRKAFLEAKQKCREKFIEPSYWAGFIMLN